MNSSNLPKFVDFQDSLVAYIDILGFDQRVRAIRTQEDFEAVSRILYAAKVTADNISNAGGLLGDFTLTAISDSIIMSAPFTSPVCTVGMLQILHKMQYELLATDMKTLLRGYINRGRVYHKDGLLFGVGYSDAYRGEEHVGAYPRIVLSPAVVENARSFLEDKDTTGMTTAFKFLREDMDGFYFIDYLNPVGSQSALQKGKLLEERTLVREFIDENLSRFRTDYRILPKYKWLENYYLQTECYYQGST